MVESSVWRNGGGLDTRSPITNFIFPSPGSPRQLVSHPEGLFESLSVRQSQWQSRYDDVCLMTNSACEAADGCMVSAGPGTELSVLLGFSSHSRLGFLFRRTATVIQTNPRV